MARGGGASDAFQAYAWLDKRVGICWGFMWKKGVLKGRGFGAEWNSRTNFQCEHANWRLIRVYTKNYSRRKDKLPTETNILEV